MPNNKHSKTLFTAQVNDSIMLQKQNIHADQSYLYNNQSNNISFADFTPIDNKFTRNLNPNYS